MTSAGCQRYILIICDENDFCFLCLVADEEKLNVVDVFAASSTSSSGQYEVGLCLQ